MKRHVADVTELNGRLAITSYLRHDGLWKAHKLEVLDESASFELVGGAIQNALKQSRQLRWWERWTSPSYDITAAALGVHHDDALVAGGSVYVSETDGVVRATAMIVHRGGRAPLGGSELAMTCPSDAELGVAVRQLLAQSPAQ
jgi:hypothetical protein